MERPFARMVRRGVPTNHAFTGDKLSLVGDFVAPTQRAAAAGVPGPTASAELLRRISSHFDTTDPGEVFRRLTTIGISSGTASSTYLPAVVLSPSFAGFSFQAQDGSYNACCCGICAQQCQ